MFATIGGPLLVGPGPVGGALVGGGAGCGGGAACGGGVVVGGFVAGGVGVVRFATAAGVAKLNTARDCVLAFAWTIATSGWPRSSVAISCVSPVAPPIGTQLRPCTLQRAH